MSALPYQCCHTCPGVDQNTTISPSLILSVMEKKQEKRLHWPIIGSKGSNAFAMWAPLSNSGFESGVFVGEVAGIFWMEVAVWRLKSNRFTK